MKSLNGVIYDVRNSTRYDKNFNLIYREDISPLLYYLEKYQEERKKKNITSKQEYSSADGCFLCNNCGCYCDKDDIYCRACGGKFIK